MLGVAKKMQSAPPVASRVIITREGPDEILRVPQSRKGVLPYLMAAFIIFWLGGWVMGFKSAATQLITKQGNDLFLAFWLAAWTVGGLFAVLFLFRILRPSLPETITLRAGGVLYDSRVPPFQMSFNYMNQKDMWKSLFQKRVVKELTANDLRSLKLRETETGNRLTVDKDSIRMDLATAATEIEREWLHAFLSKRYS
jgi:hypothetical protein